MKKKEKHLIEDIKKTAKEQVKKVKEFAKEVETKVDENKEFKRYSVEIKRMNSKMFNIDKPLYGVLDQDKLTLTYREKDDYAINEILEIGSHMYQVSRIETEKTTFPLMIEGEEHQILCRVAKLDLVDKVE